MTPILIGVLLLGPPTTPGPKTADPKAPDYRPVSCSGRYPHHLQGICTDDKGAIFWSFTTRLVMTDRQGKVSKTIEVPNHHGDLCYLTGKIYVAVNLGKFNDPRGRADSWVYVYDENLNLLAKHATPQVLHGAGGIAHNEGKFVVVGGLPLGVPENYLYEYDGKFRFLGKRVLKSGTTLMGIQTAAFADGHWWFGCYGEPKILLKTDAAFRTVRRFEFDCSLGIVPVAPGRFLVARGKCFQGKGCDGSLVAAVPDPRLGLRIVSSKRPVTKE